MNKYFKKFSIMCVMSLVLILGSCVSAFAFTDDGVTGTTNLNNTAQNSAKVGDKLTSPEIGWKRYDDTNKNIKYTGNWFIETNATAGLWKGSYHSLLGSDGNCVIKFYGTKFNLISTSRGDKSTSRSINIMLDDSKETINGDGYNTDQILLYRKTDLPLGLHTITINSSDDVNHRIIVDAIDIDSTGYLLPYNESIALDKSTMGLKEGDSGQLTATTTPAALGVTWKVSDPSVATIEVDPTNGKIIKVIALKEGTCTITATTPDGLTAICTVNVTKENSSSGDNGNTGTTTANSGENKTNSNGILNINTPSGFTQNNNNGGNGNSSNNSSNTNNSGNSGNNYSNNNNSNSNNNYYYYNNYYFYINKTA